MHDADLSAAVREPGREVHHGDAIAWLSAREDLDGASVVTSLPDASQVGRARATWAPWFEDAVALVLSRVGPGAVAMFYQTDVRSRGGWVDKSTLCQRAAARVEVPLVFHKIVCRTPPGMPRRALAGYAHLLCFGREVHEDPARPTPDVLPAAGATTWTRGMGLEACAFACRWIAQHTASRTVLDPFCGHGTVLAVANALGLDAMGVELGKERARVARNLKVVDTPAGLIFAST